MTVSEVVINRRATPFFDPTVQISRAEIDAIVEEAKLTPSSMNLQPWEILLCHSAEDKVRLQAVSFHQKKIVEASAVLVMLGNLHHHEHAPRMADSMIERGYLEAAKKDEWVQSAYAAYHDPQRQRDEAFRGTSLFAMTLMLVAESRGWATAPMGGFEPKALAAEFGLPDSHIPILLVCLGKRDPSRPILPRNDRYSASEIVHEGHF